MSEKDNSTKISCARCGRTLLIGDIGSATFTVKCKKCSAVNLIQVHPHITVQEISPAIRIKGKVMGVSLPISRTSVRIISIE